MSLSAGAAIAQTTSAKPADLIAPADRPLLTELYADVALPDLGQRLAALDRLVARTPGPTAIRGLVQGARADTFDSLERLAEARAASDEAIRLLPDWPRAQFFAFQATVFSDDPGIAADRWLTVSRADPALAMGIDAYSIDALVERLDERRDYRRASLLQNRLVDLGYAKGSPASRSERAFAVVRSRIEAGDVAGAITVIPAILSPSDAVKVLVDNDYAKLWPTMEIWAGAGLVTQWQSFLTLNRQAWEASNAVEAGIGYIRALDRDGSAKTIIATFGSMLKPNGFDSDDFQSIYFVSPLARALIDLGRAPEAIALLRRVSDATTGKGEVFGLNALANLAYDQNRIGDASGALETLARVDTVIARHRGELNLSALTGIAAVRICAAHAAGQDDMAIDAAGAFTTAGTAFLGNHLKALGCLGKADDARELLLAALAEGWRSRQEALSWIQFRKKMIVTARDRADALFEDALSHDPRVLRAVRAHGRMLESPIEGLQIADAAAH